MLFSSNKKSLLTNEQQAQDATRFLTTVSPLVQSIYSNSALFAIGKGLNNVAEIFMYLLGLAIIAFSFIMNTIFPFHILGEIISKHVYEQALTSKGEIETFNLAIKGLVILIGLLCIGIGIQIRNSGKRKTLLQQAAKELKNIETYFVEIQKAYPTPAPTSSANSNSDIQPKIEPQ